MSDQLLPVTSLSQLIDGVVIKLGSALGWIWLLLIGVIVVNVISRYLFSEGFIELEELHRKSIPKTIKKRARGHPAGISDAVLSNPDFE